MIAAAKNPVVEKLFARINRAMVRRHFHALHLSGEPASLDRAVPIIIYGNHSCWWDGLIEFLLSRDIFGFDAYLMMDEEQMSRYRFFRWIGAFSVNRSSRREAVASLRYAADLFSRPGRALWIYPQGVMLPNDVRPLKFETGIARLLEMVPRAQVVAVAHRYEFLHHQRPEAFIKFGPVRMVGRLPRGRDLLPELEQELTNLLDGLKGEIVTGDLSAYRTILSGRSSTNETWDRVRMLPRGR